MNFELFELTACARIDVFACEQNALAASFCLLEPDDSKPLRPEEPIEALCGDPRGFLRLAAGAIAGAGSDNRSGDPEAGEKQEIRALARFGSEAGLMLEAASILLLFAEKENRLAGGVEHEVAVLREEGLVIKDYDARLFNEAGYPLYKPTECLFDYLTDHLLANHFFGDDIRLKGFYEADDRFHIVITQPFIQGRHPSWDELVTDLQGQGLEQVDPGTGKARFWVDGGPAGRIIVTDVHEDNVIVATSNTAYPIDVHFSFPGRERGIAALTALGIW